MKAMPSEISTQNRDTLVLRCGPAQDESHPKAEEECPSVRKQENMCSSSFLCGTALSSDWHFPDYPSRLGGSSGPDLVWGFSRVLGVPESTLRRSNGIILRDLYTHSHQDTMKSFPLPLSFWGQFRPTSYSAVSLF